MEEKSPETDATTIWNRAGPCRKVLRFLQQAVLSFCLTPACAGSVWLPVLWGYLLSAESELALFLSAAGGIAGALLFWEGTVRLQCLAGIFVCLFAVELLSNSALWKRKWGPAGICVLVTVTICGTTVVQGENLGLDKIYDPLLQMGAAGLSQWIFLDERTHAGRMALITLGMCQISLPFGMNLGLLAA